MLFNSLEFILFFSVVVTLYFAIPHRARWAFLLAASYIFYGWWRIEYLSLIIFSTVVDYVAGLKMGNQKIKKRRLPWLILSLVSNLGLLFAFKYLGFFAESVEAIASFIGVDGRLNVPSLLLPVGISFYTFQSLAYSIDVYRGRQIPEKHFGIFALYVSFWPQLVAGPIERSQNLLPQFREKYQIDWRMFADGLKLMMWGMFKKVVIADRLAIYVNSVYNNPDNASALTFIIATYFFAIQIYCDFSGYSDIAIGAAQTMGFKLMENFRRPYFSKSIGEFWRRWHISLSTWFRDYLYIPLGGNRVSRWRWYFNLFVVFLISGIWHGAAWTFVIWGALHGIYLIIGAVIHPHRLYVWSRFFDYYNLWQSKLSDHIARFPSPKSSLIRRLWSVTITFHLVLVSWVFFRANNFTDVIYFFELLTVPAQYTIKGISAGLNSFEVLLGIGAIGILFIVQCVERKHSMRKFLSKRPFWVRYSTYVALILSIIFFGEFGSAEFIYFQF